MDASPGPRRVRTPRLYRCSATVLWARFRPGPHRSSHNTKASEAGSAAPTARRARGWPARRRPAAGSHRQPRPARGSLVSRGTTTRKDPNLFPCSSSPEIVGSRGRKKMPGRQRPEPARVLSFDSTDPVGAAPAFLSFFFLSWLGDRLVPVGWRPCASCSAAATWTRRAFGAAQSSRLSNAHGDEKGAGSPDRDCGRVRSRHDAAEN